MANSRVVPLSKMVQKSRAVTASIPAPIGGWNARDTIANMDPEDAVKLINWFPGTTQCNLRYGYQQFSTGLPADVDSLFSYSGGATNKLFAVSNDSIFDVTSGGAAPAASVTGLSNARWQYVNFATPGGNFIICCNGADNVRSFDGTTWASPAITGVTSSTLVGVNVFKNRLWFVENNTLKAWYLPTQSIAGAAQALDLSSFCPHGGYIMAMGTWTIDAGQGVDDHAVFITNNGDCLVYRGTDPTSAATWALVGVWWLGSPVGRRCFVKYKGDLLLICEDGVVPMSGALQSSRVNPRVALTDKIQSAMSEAVSFYGGNFGWQLLPYPQQNMLLLNVPVAEGISQQQYVMNTITGAWCQFTGWAANCWELHEDQIYFGGGDFVGLAWSTQADAGTAISSSALQAFNYFGSRGQQKRFSMFRPTFVVNGSPTIYGNMNVDFDKSEPSPQLATISVSGAVWDTGIWDTALWGENVFSRSWQGATGVGVCAAPAITSTTNGLTIEWVSTDVIMEPGGFL